MMHSLLLVLGEGEQASECNNDESNNECAPYGGEHDNDPADMRAGDDVSETHRRHCDDHYPNR